MKLNAHLASLVLAVTVFVTSIVWTVPGFAQEQKSILTEVEQLKIQIANLQIELRNQQSESAKWISNYGQCQTKLLSDPAPVNAMLSALEQGIEKNHVGYDFDLKTGNFTQLKPAEKK